MRGIFFCFMLVFTMTSCAEPYRAEEWDYRTRQLKEFAAVFPQAHTVAIVFAYGNVITIANQETKNLDEPLKQKAMQIVKANLINKGYQLKEAPINNAQNGNLDKIKESYKDTINSLYSSSRFWDLVFPSMNKKSVALSASETLGPEAVEYAKAANADLLVIFGYNGFNDMVSKTYLPLSGTPPKYSQPFMKGFATVGLVDGHTGALLWAHNGDASIAGHGSIVE